MEKHGHGQDRMDEHRDDAEGRVTFPYLHEQLGKVVDRVSRLERIVVVLVIAVASPKLGGPTIPDVASGFVRFFF